MLERVLGRSNFGLIWGILLPFFLTDWGNRWKISVEIASLWAETWMWDLLNINLECCWLSHDVWLFWINFQTLVYSCFFVIFCRFTGWSSMHVQNTSRCWRNKASLLVIACECHMICKQMWCYQLSSMHLFFWHIYFTYC